MAAAAAMAMCASNTFPQLPRPPIELIDRPHEPHRLAPEFLREPASPGFVLPPAIPRAETPLLSSGLKVLVRKFRFVGNTAFSDEVLEMLAAPFLNRRIGNDELEDLRHALTRHYVSHGYVNSGATIPDQEVTDGIIAIRIVEGRLADVVVTGEHPFHPDFLRRRLALGAGPPLNVNRLQQQMQIMLLNPQIERINAELGPGLTPGEAILQARVAGAKQKQLSLSVANNRSPSVGGVRGEMQGSWQNLFGRGDKLSLLMGRAEGLNDYALHFSVPVTAHDTSVSIRYDKNTSLVIEQPFDKLYIRSNTDTLELGIAHPFVRTPQRELSGRALFARRHSATFLLGQPFSFVAGSADGKSAASALRLGLDWVERGEDRVVALRSIFSFGVDAHSAGVPASAPGARFAAWLGQFQWVKRLDKEQGQLVFRADVQLASASLLAFEKIAVGGSDTVRGYRENRMVRDTGQVASLEYRKPLLRVPVAILGDDASDGILHLALFADAGRARDKSTDAGADAIYSVGAGVRWEITKDFHAQLYRGIALTHPQPSSTRDLQDSGIHFHFSLQKAF